MCVRSEYLSACGLEAAGWRCRTFAEPANSDRPGRCTTVFQVALNLEPHLHRVYTYSNHRPPMSKRRRTGDAAEVHDPASSNGTLVMRSDIRMEDGSIVQAENTQFKAHRSLLSRASPIFSDMFSISQPSEGNEVVDGCPLVHLQTPLCCGEVSHIRI
jgi:hypothetical protein